MRKIKRKIKNLLFCNRLVLKKEPKPFYPKVESGEIEGVNIQNLLLKYDSPLFVASEKSLEKKYKYLEDLIEKAYSNSTIAYSFKTNHLSGIIKVFKNLGAMAEVVSGFEYFLAKKIGYKGEEIIFNGPYKKDEELELALRDKVLVNIDNFDELIRIEKIAKKLKTKPKIGIRLNSTAFGKSRFGFNIESGEAEKAVKMIKKGSVLKLVGLHMHLGGHYPPHFYKKEAEILSGFAIKIGGLEYIDLGGGFPAYGSPHTDAWCSCIFPLENYFRAIGKVLNEKFPNQEIKIIFEPGRGVVDEGMVLVTTVINTKPLTVDAPISILQMSQWRRLLVKPIISKKETVKTNIYGISCRENDILAENVLLPKLKMGDKLIFYNVGAYNIPMSSQFSFLRPGVIMIEKNKKVYLLRKKEKAENLI